MLDNMKLEIRPYYTVLYESVNHESVHLRIMSVLVAPLTCYEARLK